MSNALSVGLTEDDQADAFERAAEVVAGDVEDGVVDANQWGDEVTAGEVVRVLAEAYLNELSVDRDALDARATPARTAELGDA